MTTLFERALLLDVALGTPLGAGWFPEGHSPSQLTDVPGTFLMDGHQLASVRELARADDSQAVRIVEAVREHCETAVEHPGPAVTLKTSLPPSGDVHDYYSLAKYWWPDPGEESGRPYVRHDGQVNPEWRSERFDATRLVELADRVGALALGEYYLRSGAYGAAASALIERWFLDPATRQTPHFRYAQVVPGRSEPRGVGLIEARHLLAVTEAVTLLDHAEVLEADTRDALREWFDELLRWMLHSEQGQLAQQRRNNIGFWFDLQVIAYAWFVGDVTTAERTLRRSVTPRLIEQMERDGSLSAERTRADPAQYMALSAVALMGLSRASQQLDADIWGGHEAEGRTLAATYEWVARRTLPAGVRARAAELLRRTRTEDEQRDGRGAHGRGALSIASRDGEPVDIPLSVMLAYELRSNAVKTRRLAQRLTAAEAAAKAADDRAADLTARIAESEGRPAAADQLETELQDRTRELELASATLDVERKARIAVQRELAEAARDRERLEADLEEKATALREASRRLELVYASTSWRMSLPLRFLGRAIGRTRATLVAVVRWLGRMTSRAGAKADGTPAHEQARSEEPPSDGDAVGSTVRATAIPRAGTPTDTGTQVSEASLREEYFAKGLHEVADRFVLYRIIGNDLPPRHKPGQSRRNVEFILQHEPVFASCEKRWVVNRIVDTDEERRIIGLLRQHDQSFIHLPFRSEQYCQIDWDFESFPFYGYLLSDRFQQLDPPDQRRATVQAYRNKNLYVMNNNGARNHALTEGRSATKWIMPWDGNCFLTRRAWNDILTRVLQRPHFKYFIVPMARIGDNERLLGQEPDVVAEEEPQIVFRQDAQETFDPEFPYGRRPKVELLVRLGVPGPWDQWANKPWDLPFREVSSEAGTFSEAGWVVRLASGETDLEEPTRIASRHRGHARDEAILATLVGLDARCLQDHAESGSSHLVYFRKEVVDGYRSEASSSGWATDVVDELRRRAEEALGRGPHSVVDKSSIPPSGDPHDYWHPAPYWWPDPDAEDGRPYVRRDGERVPGTELYEVGSERYDRTRLQRLFDDTTVLALASCVMGETTFAEHAARLVRTWFLEPESRMNPHLRFAQVRLGHDDDEGRGSGLVEFKDVYFFLDGIRLLEAAGTLDGDDSKALRGWFEQYLTWLLESPQGSWAATAANNHGTLYDLQVTAVAAYVSEFEVLADAARRSHDRLLAQFESDGSQPAELQHTLTAHYSAFNLQSWINLADIFESIGSNLWDRVGEDGRSLGRGLDWFLTNSRSHDEGWPFQQIRDFDWTRRAPLAFAYADAFGIDDETLRGWNFGGGGEDLTAMARPTYDPHDGIAPFWCFARPSTLGAVGQPSRNRTG